MIINEKIKIKKLFTSKAMILLLGCKYQLSGIEGSKLFSLAYWIKKFLLISTSAAKKVKWINLILLHLLTKRIFVKLHVREYVVHERIVTSVKFL